MTMLIYQEDVEQLLSIKATIPVMEDMFRMAGERSTENPPRFRMPINDGFLQFGPAALHESKVVGFKLWANFGSGPSRGWNFLFDMASGDLVAIIHSYTIGVFRTSAATSVAVKYLSAPDAATVGVFGTGRHAETQLEAVCAVRPIKHVRAYSRNAENRAAYCRKMSEKLGIDVTPAERPEDTVRDADIVVTMTDSKSPVLKGEWLGGHGLVIAAGANHWYKREVDEDVVRRASMVVVDEKGQAKVEGGDLLYPIAHGVTTWERVEELGDVVVGRAKVPDLANNIVLFCSHGLATEDVAISAKVYELAKAKGMGREIDLALGRARSEIARPSTTSSR